MKANVSQERLLIDIFYKQLVRLLIYVCLALLVTFALFPIYWLVATSLKSLRELVAVPPVLLPANLDFSAYATLFQQRGFGRLLWNSFIVSFVGTFLCLAIAIPCAYSLVRLHSRRTDRAVAFFMYFAAVFPLAVAVVPLFLLYINLGLFDTRTGLIIAYIAFNLGFATWVLRGIFIDAPKELEEAAMIDGATRLGAALRITLPVTLPSIFALLTIIFISLWNDFLLALILTVSPSAMTVMIGVMGTIAQHEIEWQNTAAAGTIAIIPVIVATLLFRRYLIRGLTFGLAK